MRTEKEIKERIKFLKSLLMRKPETPVTLAIDAVVKCAIYELEWVLGKEEKIKQIAKWKT
jgi:hypothetical protein